MVENWVAYVAAIIGILLGFLAVGDGLLALAVWWKIGRWK